MMDKMQLQTDKDLEELEKRLKREYRKAQKEVSEKADAFFASFQQQDEAMRLRLLKGDITNAEYENWRRNQMMLNQRYTELEKRLAAEYTQTNVRAANMINDSLYDTFANNYNYQIYLAERDGKIATSFALFDRDAVRIAVAETPDIMKTAQVNIPKNLRWNEQKIASALAQGILQGDSINHISDRLQAVTNMNRSSAVRSARTLTTGAENGGRYQCSKRLENKGVEQEKQWMSTLDERTRDTHRAIDQETVPLDAKFSNGLRYPGDPRGDGSEVYNCRCRYVTQFKRFPSTFHRSTDALEESYEEWKRGRNKG